MGRRPGKQLKPPNHFQNLDVNDPSQLSPYPLYEVKPQPQHHTHFRSRRPRCPSPSAGCLTSRTTLRMRPRSWRYAAVWGWSRWMCKAAVAAWQACATSAPAGQENGACDRSFRNTKYWTRICGSGPEDAIFLAHRKAGPTPRCMPGWGRGPEGSHVFVRRRRKAPWVRLVWFFEGVDGGNSSSSSCLSERSGDKSKRKTWWRTGPWLGWKAERLLITACSGAGRCPEADGAFLTCARPAVNRCDFLAFFLLPARKSGCLLPLACPASQGRLWKSEEMEWANDGKSKGGIHRVASPPHHCCLDDP